MITTYQDAMNFLYSHVNFEHRRLDQYSPENISLDRPALLLNRLNNPQKRYASIHIAGTKGKGSVAAMCAASCRQAGMKVGLYTSPHLQSFRDRIRVLTPDDPIGRISRNEVVELTNVLQDAARNVMDLTWYELVTALAFLHFARSEIDLAVVEVGLGGRLDATNVITPLVSVITSLSLDHTYLLGDTLAEIAAEKAGIIKSGVPVVTSRQAPEAMAQIARIASGRGAPLTAVGVDWDYDPLQILAADRRGSYKWEQQVTVVKAVNAPGLVTPSKFKLSLAGRHQQENAVVALAALNIMRSQFPQLTWDAIKAGLSGADWPGRFQLLPSKAGLAPILLDCAHNVDSARKVADALENDFTYRRLWLIVGISEDKDLEGILAALLPVSSHSTMTASSHPRAADPAHLHNLASEMGYETKMAPSVTDAILAIWPNTDSFDLICVTGSIFVVSDLLNDWDVLQSDLNRANINPALPLTGNGVQK